jgi:hypothetical protein
MWKLAYFPSFTAQGNGNRQYGAQSIMHPSKTVRDGALANMDLPAAPHWNDVLVAVVVGRSTDG